MPRHNKAFTLVEILIVITMLAILAAMILPRMVGAQEEARESAIETDVQMMRRQILVYSAQHIGKGPHLDASGNFDPNNLPDRLTGKTDMDGTINPSGKCGPYMQEWPTNPYSSSAVAGKISFGTNAAPPRNGTTGWYYNTDTCEISPNSTEGGEELNP